MVRLCDGIFGKWFFCFEFFLSRELETIIKIDESLYIFHRQPLKAEGHEVLYLTKSSIVQILFGAKGSVWIVYEHGDEMGDHCRRILNFPAFNMPKLIH